MVKVNSVINNKVTILIIKTGYNVLEIKHDFPIIIEVFGAL